MEETNRANDMRGCPRGTATPPSCVARLTSATCERITDTLRIRGADIDDTLRQAIGHKAREIAEATLDHADDPDDINVLASACASILCDLPSANIMEILLPDPHLAPFERDIRAIAQARRRGQGPTGARIRSCAKPSNDTQTMRPPIGTQ